MYIFVCVGIMSDYEEVIYWFTGHNAANEWETNPAGLDNNNIGDYASTDNDNDAQEENANNAITNNIGEISAVELRAFGYGDGGDYIIYAPNFLIGGAGATFNWIPPNGIGAAAYDAWRDITADPAAPDPWTWTDVNGLDCTLTYMKDGKANILYISTLEIRVTFRQPVQPGYSILPFHY